MPFWVESPEETAINAVTEQMAKDAGFQDRYDAIGDLREASTQGLAITPREAARANGFFRVASLQGPLLDLQQVLDPNWLSNKKRFYSWLRGVGAKHCVYDRRRHFNNSDLTVVDGKVV